MKMKNRVNAIIAVAALVILIPVASLAISPYSQDFEGLNAADATALENDGWLIFANVFGPDMVYWYGYGVFPAPNHNLGFSQIVTGEGGADQGLQQLVTFSDYNNADHALGAFIETLVFQEFTIGAGDVSETWVFEFDAKLGNLEGVSTAQGFIKTLDPNAGHATTNYVIEDMTLIPNTWGTYTISLAIDGGLVGQLLQIGFQTVATNYEGSGVFYDNINFATTGPVATEDISFGAVKSLFR
jgi:hypothetical protein